MFAVQQQNNAGKQPFKVQVLGSTISGAMGGVAFSNVGGLLTLQDVSVESSTLISLASTGSISSFEQGSTFLRRVTVTNSNIAVCRLLYSV